MGAEGEVMMWLYLSASESTRSATRSAMYRLFSMSGFLGVAFAFAFLLLAVRPVSAEEYMAHADFTACPRKYVPSTSADEGPFTKPQCLARVEAARQGNHMSCARYSCEPRVGGVSTDSSGGTAGALQNLAAKSIADAIVSGNINEQIGALGVAAWLAAILLNADQRQNTERQGAERAARAAQEAEAVARAQEYERERMKQLEARHQQLLASLKGGLGNTELGLKRYGSGKLELKGGTEMFGMKNATGTVNYGEETSGIALKMPDAPPTPRSKPVDVSQMDKLRSDYFHAADEYGKADLQRQQLEEAKKLTERIRREAEERYQEQKRQAASIQKEQPAKPEKDDKLAEAEKLFNQATELDRKATQELDIAKQNVKQAKLDLDRTEKERAKAEKSLSEAGQGPLK